MPLSDIFKLILFIKSNLFMSFKIKSLMGENDLLYLKKLLVKSIPRPNNKFSGFRDKTNFFIISESLMGKPSD